MARSIAAATFLPVTVVKTRYEVVFCLYVCLCVYMQVLILFLILYYTMPGFHVLTVAIAMCQCGETNGSINTMLFLY